MPVSGFKTLIIGSLLLASTISGCQQIPSQPDEADLESLSIMVSYRERMLPPPGAEVTVSLSDISKADAAATELASQTASAQSGPPYFIQLNYDASQINPAMRYSVRATIQNGEQLLFSTTTHIDPFAEGVQQPIRALMFPISHARQAESRPDAELTNTYWKLVTLQGKAVSVGASGKELFLQLQQEENRIRGYAGCNNFFGNFTVEGSKLSIGMLGATRMMCADNMIQEQQFLTNLPQTGQYLIKGDKLRLLDKNGKTLASFEARYMN